MCDYNIMRLMINICNYNSVNVKLNAEGQLPDVLQENWRNLKLNYKNFNSNSQNFKR